MGLETQWGAKTIPVLVKCISHSTLTKSLVEIVSGSLTMTWARHLPSPHPASHHPPFPSAACLPSLAGCRDVLLYFPIRRWGVCDYFYHICLQASSKPENSRVPFSSSWTEGISGMKAARLCFVATHSGGGVGQSLSPYNDLETVSYKSPAVFLLSFHVSYWSVIVIRSLLSAGLVHGMGNLKCDQ